MRTVKCVCACALMMAAVSASAQNNKVKPFRNLSVGVEAGTAGVGIGWGRAVPNNRIGFQFNMGVLFHGTPKIDSSNAEVSEALNDEAEDGGITKIMRKVTVYPVISFKLVGRIF